MKLNFSPLQLPNELLNMNQKGHKLSPAQWGPNQNMAHEF